MGDVVVMGDLKARVGLLNDHIVQDTIPNNVPCTLYCVKENLATKGFTRQNNEHVWQTAV